MNAETYDYIVIGGGSSGAVVASRLAAASARVLVLEAGGTDCRLDVLIPAGTVSVYEKANWKYPTEPDPSRTGSPEALMAGKVLGGSGSINSCVYIRGNRADFDGWARLGCAGWDYESVLPCFKRMESWQGGADEYRGGTGPISVVEQSDHGEANQAYIKAAMQAGHAATPDFNGASQDGAALGQVNFRRGIRSQSSREYFKRVAPKQYLTVRTNAHVQRILFEGKRAIGVQYRTGSGVHIAKAREEVILSAGALGSPKLLLLSGIGPRDEIGRFNIDLVAEVPGVGANLQDHAYLMQRWHSKLPTMNKLRMGTILRGVADYARNGTGLLAMTIVHAQVMHRSDPSLEAPDLQLFFTPFAITRGVDENGMFNVQLAKQEGFTSASTFLKPRTRGRVSLRSASPADPPRIEYQFLADPDDLRVVLKGIREVHRIMQQPAMAAITNGQFDPERGRQTDADWEHYARNNVTSSYHPVGTCKMGIDDQAVVDPELRVRGVKGLRVVDASVMPRITSGNTNAPSMMIGERAAELILAQRGA